MLTCDERHRSVLVVEDEPVIRELISHGLRQAGYTVHAAADAAEAMTLVERLDGDLALALVDVLLPDMDGRSLYEWLRAHCPQTKIVICTGLSSRSPEMEFVRHSGSTVIPKPFSLNELVRSVGRAIGQD